jgi:hypothetical protein
MELTHSLALDLLRQGQIGASRYFQLCRERGWPPDEVPVDKIDRKILAAAYVNARQAT